MADYPRLLSLDPDTEERLKQYLDQELFNHYAERTQYIDDLKRWQKDYWAKPSTETKTFPFTGASNIVIPLSAIAIEAIHARTITQLFGGPQFVNAKPINPQWADFQRPVEQFLDHELLNCMKIRKPLSDSLLECEKFGTTVGKVGYEKIVRRAVRTIGDQEEEFDVVVKQGATFDAVSMGRILMPYYAKDPQSAPWVGEEHSGNPHTIKTLEQSGMFKRGTFEELEKWVLRSPVGMTGMERELQHNQEILEKREPQWPKYIDWVELWLSFDVDMSGREKEIVVHYHRASRTFMAIRYNWYYDLHRPYRTCTYFPVEHRWTGIGVCKQNEQFQREITTIHRQRLDNATLANMRMIKIHKLSGYGPKEPIFPGKMWFLDDMTHVEAIQMGEVYPSSYNNEQGVLQYSQQRTGVNEVTLGMPQVGTPGTATSDLARIQEGNKRFDFFFGNVKDYTAEIISDIAAEIAQFGPRYVEYYQTAEDGQMVEAFFNSDPKLIRHGLLLQLNHAGAQENKVIDRQNWVQIAGMLNQYYTGMMQLSVNNPQIAQLIAQRGLAAVTEAMKQILESYDVKNVGRIIVPEFLTPSDLEKMLANPGGLLGAGAQQGGISGPPPIGQNAGMVNPAQIIPQPGPTSNGAAY